MPIDEALGSDVRALLTDVPGIVEKRMFGGLAFLINGNMSVGVHGEELIVRVAPTETEAALQDPDVRVFDITGRPMKGWLLVGGGAVREPERLEGWVRRGTAYASSLPGK
jgi:hypothetical protein